MFLANAKRTGQVSENELPLMFFRVRSVEQFHSITSKLDQELLSVLTGFVFPKFCIDNAEGYFSHLRELNDRYGLNLYAMPIIEGREVAFKETRLASLLQIKQFLDANKELVLNVRVGGTDFSSAFGVRRGVDYSIYDIMTVSECLCDILNVFGRDNEYVVSGPVWEYYSGYNWENGLIQELKDDKLCGFTGKTVIHPNQISVVNKVYQVTRSDFNDAKAILNWDKKSDSLVSGNLAGERMNEYKTHHNWAEKILFLAEVFGITD